MKQEMGRQSEVGSVTGGRGKVVREGGLRIVWQERHQPILSLD